MSIETTVLKLGPADAGRRLTSDEFANADFAEPYRYERVEGRLVVEPPAGEDHVVVSEPWRDQLVVYKLAHPEIVDRVVSEAWMRIDEDNDRIGDIGVYLKSDEPPARIPDRVPDLVYEIVSPGRRAHERDYVLKLQQYLLLGVREYVVIDRIARTVTVFTQGSGTSPERVLSPGDVYTTPLLPGLAVDVGVSF